MLFNATTIVANITHKVLDTVRNLGHEVYKYVHGRRNIQPMKQSIDDIVADLRA